MSYKFTAIIKVILVINFLLLMHMPALTMCMSEKILGAPSNEYIGCRLIYEDKTVFKPSDELCEDKCNSACEKSIQPNIFFTSIVKNEDGNCILFEVTSVNPRPLDPSELITIKDIRRKTIGEMEIRIDDIDDENRFKKLVILSLRNHTIRTNGTKELTGIGRLLTAIAKVKAKKSKCSLISVNAFPPSAVPRPQPLINNPLEFYVKNGFKVVYSDNVGSRLEFRLETSANEK